MINSIFVRGSQIIIKVEFKDPVSGYTSEFSISCPSEFHAKLMADNLQNNFYQTIEKIRKLEYESGWSDAKKKKTKRTYFYSSMTIKGY